MIGDVVDTAWTEARVAQLKKLWRDGQSAGQIAGILGGGVTRNAVMGKIHRLKLEQRTHFAQSSVSRAARHPATVKRRPGDSGGGQYRRTVRAHDAAAKAGDDVPSVDATGQTFLHGNAWEPLSGTTPIPLIDLRHDQCRWPLGDKPMLFCAATVETVGKPYCAAHRARASGWVR